MTEPGASGIPLEEMADKSGGRIQAEQALRGGAAVTGGNARRVLGLGNAHESTAGRLGGATSAVGTWILGDLHK